MGFQYTTLVTAVLEIESLDSLTELKLECCGADG